MRSGTRLGPYEIVAPLGAGGIGAAKPSCGRERSGMPHHVEIDLEALLGDLAFQELMRPQEGL